MGWAGKHRLLTVKQKSVDLSDGIVSKKILASEFLQILNLDMRRNEKKSIPNNNKGQKVQRGVTFICKNMHLIAFNSPQQLENAQTDTLGTF